MKKKVLLVIGLSFNMLTFAANELWFNRLLMIGLIVDQVRPDEVRNNHDQGRRHAVRNNNLLLLQPMQAQHIYAHDADQKYKTLKRNQPQRSTKNYHHHNH